jgi:hypothetical protein
MATIDVKDAAGTTVAIEKPLAPGRTAAATSRPVVLSNEDKTALDAVATQTTAAAILAKIIAAPATEAKQDSTITLVGAVTETAPATDTASSGLNGRLQRIAQRLTSLIALVPASLGSKAAASSLAVTQSTEDAAQLGSLTETAPATDTASSGLNGRLQRIAQRITSLIALVPASLGQKAMSASFAVTLASDDPLSVLQSASSASITSLASSATSAQLLAANAARKGLILNNTDANAVLVKYGTTASATSFTVRIPLNGYWEMPKPIYTGRIDVIWEADGSGSIYATEL